jgi:hypothetical protein
MESSAYETDDSLSHQRIVVKDYGPPEFGEIIDVREAGGVGGRGTRLVIGCVAAFSNTVSGDGCREIFIDAVAERTRADLVAYVELKPTRTERVRALRAV